MLFLIHGIAGLFFIVAIIFTCSLFTNAIEHLGTKLKLGNNAVGSILAVIGTSLPETIVPLVAIFGAFLFKCNIKTGENIALGAIVGSPFMLSTLSLFLLGVVLLILFVSKKREKAELDLDYENVVRDCKYFLLAYIPAVLSTFLPHKIKLLVVVYLLLLYCIFVSRTILKSKENYEQQNPDELIFLKPFQNFRKFDLFFIIFQVFVSLFGLVIFSHFFVAEIRYFSAVLNLSPLVLSLIITPFATELPECVNSIIWVKNGKDDLAVANVIGAVVFQAMIPASIGIALTDWILDGKILLNALLVIICAIFFTSCAVLYKKIKLFPLLFCGVFYFSYLIYLFLK